MVARDLRDARQVQAEYFSVYVCQAITGISSWTWRSWAYSGKCASVKAGSGKRARLLIPASEVERIMADGLRPAVAR
jgi:hypothetical protein